MNHSDKSEKINSFFDFESKDRIGIISLNNTIKNTIDQPIFLNLDSFHEWIESENLIGLVITGNKRHFSNGANLESIFKRSGDIGLLTDEIRQAHRILQSIMMLNIPVVAAIKGVCFGAGLEIAMFCHFRICSNNAMLALPESSAGIMPGFMGTIMLQRYIGFSKACEMILTGNMISTDLALNTGLVDYVVDDQNLLEFSINYIQKLTRNRTDKQVHSIMQAMNNARIQLLSETAERETEMFCCLLQEKKEI